MSATSTKQNEKTTTVKPPREHSVVWAAIQVLDGKRKPMHPDEITEEIQKQRLAKLGGKTPNASVAARLAVHHKQGLYFDRPEKGRYMLKKGVTAKSIASAIDSGSKATAKAGGGSKASGRKPASRGRRQTPKSKPAQQDQDAAPRANGASTAVTEAIATA